MAYRKRLVKCRNEDCSGIQDGRPHRDWIDSETWHNERCPHCEVPYIFDPARHTSPAVIVRHWDRLNEHVTDVQPGTHFGMDIVVGRDCPATRQGVREYAKRNGYRYESDGI